MIDYLYLKFYFFSFYVNKWCHQDSHDFKNYIFKIFIYFKKSTNKLNVYLKALYKDKIPSSAKLFKNFVKFKVVK